MSQPTAVAAHRSLSRAPICRLDGVGAETMRAPHPACLPWYDFDETRADTDALWRWLADALAEAGFDHVPDCLTREVDHDSVLEHPELLLSQTCGLVAVGRARHSVQVVATPRYRAPGCVGAAYRSFVVVPRSCGAEGIADLRGLRCAINEPWSHSGMNGLRGLVAPAHRDGRFFASVRESGSHIQSLEWLAAGAADVAAIDCVTFELVRRHRPHLHGAVRIVTETAPAPAPPFVTTAGAPAERVAALRAVLHGLAADGACADLRGTLLLDGFADLDVAAYEPMLAAERRARAAGYLEMPYDNQPRPS